MSIPRGRIVTLSPYEARQTLPVRIHKGDSLDLTINFVRLLRIDETPAELLSAASAAGQGVSVSNVAFEGRYLSLTISGAQQTGQAVLKIAVSTDQGRTISRSLIVNTIYDDLAIEPVIPDQEPEQHALLVGRDDSIPESHKWGYGQWWLNPEEAPIPITGGELSPATWNGEEISSIRYETFYEFLTPQTLSVSFIGDVGQDFFTTFENSELGVFASADAYFTFDATNSISNWEWIIPVSPGGNWSPVGSEQTVTFTG